MNYEIKPGWDTSLAIVFKLGTITPDSPLNGLVYNAIKETAGAPVATVGKYIPGATVQVAGDSDFYRNDGTTAAPAFVLV